MCHERCATIYLTRIESPEFEANTIFPDIDLCKYELSAFLAEGDGKMCKEGDVFYKVSQVTNQNA